LSEVKYDLVTAVRIGWGAGGGQYTEIENIVSFSDRLISRDGQHVDPINVINDPVPRGVHHNQKHYVLELVLDSDNYEALYTQQVDTGVATSRAIRQGADNDPIDYFVVYIRESDGTTTTYTYESGKVWCIGEVHEYSMERNLRHQGTTTYSFLCLGSRSRAGW